MRWMRMSIRLLVVAALVTAACPGRGVPIDDESPQPGLDPERFVRLDDGLYELGSDGLYHKVLDPAAEGLRPPVVPQPVPGRPDEPQRYLRLDDGLYELGRDGTYHKVEDPDGLPTPPWNPPPPRPGRPDRYLRLDDGLYELQADGTYARVQDGRVPGGLPADDRWPNPNRPNQPWPDEGPRPPRPNPQPQPNNFVIPGPRPPKPAPGVDPNLIQGTDQSMAEHAKPGPAPDPWFEFGRRLRAVLDEEARRKRGRK